MKLEAPASLDLIAIMKCTLLFLVVGAISIFYLDAFLPSSHRRHPRPSPIFEGVDGDSPNRLHSDHFGHKDIIWKIRPPPEVSQIKRLWLRLAANMIRLDSMVKGEAPPLVLCPKNKQAVLEAHYRPSELSKYERIARFGFTTQPGPPIPPIRETIHDLYGLNKDLMVGVGAIIYMFVEEPYRKKGVGSLALEVISLIHSIQGCDFIVLVADDNGSGKLVQWYEEHGFFKAPKLQECFGSPNGVHGLTMISPSRRILPHNCYIQWW